MILTRQGAIAHFNKLTVTEIAGAGKGYPTEVGDGQQANLPKPSFVQLDNMQTVARERFVKYLGALDRATMRELRPAAGAGAGTRRRLVTGASPRRREYPRAPRKRAAVRRQDREGPLAVGSRWVIYQSAMSRKWRSTS